METNRTLLGKISTQGIIINIDTYANMQPLQIFTTQSKWPPDSNLHPKVEYFNNCLPQSFVAVIRRIEMISLYTHAVNAKGPYKPLIMEGIAFRDMAKFIGEAGISLDILPILIGLGGTATGLGLIVTGVLMALWRKHAVSPSKPKPLQQPSITTFAVKDEEEDGPIIKA